MTAYYVAYGWLFLCMALGLLTKRIRIAAAIGFLPILFLIAARGLVGTDTAQYLFIIRAVWASGLEAVSLEPLFGIFSNLLMARLYDPFTTLVVISVMIALLMFIAGLRLERTPLVFMAVVMPYFMMDMTMNGVRYGLAFAIITLATGFLLQGRRIVFLLLALLAALTQLSSLLLAVGIWALLEARLRSFVAIVVLVVPLVAFFGTYLDDKAAIYAGLYIVSPFSGLVPLFLSLALLGGLFTIQELRSTSAPQFAVLLGAVLVSYLMTRFTSGGLRMQQLVLFLIYLYGAARIYRLSVDVWRHQLLIVVSLVVALVGGAFRLDNFAEDKDFGPTPFNPYYFIWNHYGFD